MSGLADFPNIPRQVVPNSITVYPYAVGHHGPTRYKITWRQWRKTLGGNVTWDLKHVRVNTQASVDFVQATLLLQVVDKEDVLKP